MDKIVKLKPGKATDPVMTSWGEIWKFNLQTGIEDAWRNGGHLHQDPDPSGVYYNVCNGNCK